MATTGSTSAVPTERRALAAALDAPSAFRPRAGAGALRAADAVVERWAPEGGAPVAGSAGARPASRRGTMASLAFADRMLAGWMAASDAGLGLRGMNLMMGYARDGFATRHVPTVSWLMPRPAYLDELAWIAAARAAASAPRPAPTTQASAGAPAAMTLGYVAPDLASAASEGIEAADGARQLWSPMLPAGVASAMDAWALADSVAETTSAAAGPVARRPAFGASLARAIMSTASTKTSAASGPSAPRRAALAGLADSLRAYVVNPEVANDAAAVVGAATRADHAEALAPRAPATAYDLLVRAMAHGDAPATVAGPRLALPAGLGGALLSARLDAVVSAHAPIGGGQEPGRSPMAIAPRVAHAPMPMPMPLASMIAPSAVAAPVAVAALSSPPAALRHVAWSDRWLARMAGASPAALEQFSQATGQVPAGRAATLAPTLSLLQVLPDGAASSPGLAAPGRQAEALVAPLPVRAIDDNEATPDDVFVAIATARGRGRRAAPVARTPVALEPVIFTPTPSVADRVLGAPASMASSAGLSSALAHSPVAAALRGAIGGSASTVSTASDDPRTLTARPLTPATRPAVAPAVPVDVRSLSPAAVAMAYLSLPAELAPSRGVTSAFAPGGVVAPRARAERTTTSIGAELGASIGASVSAPQLDADARPAVVRRDAGGPAPLASAFAPVFTFAALADGAAPANAWSAAAHGAAPIGARPGDLAERATELGHATEQSAAELSFDFVAPETVLAARGYGLPAGDAMVAERLGRASAGTLLAAAASVEQRVVHAMLADGDHADEGGAMSTASPARRLPRGAFLWPAAALGSLGVQPLTADPSRVSTVVALELLAAQAVAAVGEQAAASAPARRALASMPTSTPLSLGDEPAPVAISNVASNAPSVVGAYPQVAVGQVGGEVGSASYGAPLSATVMRALAEHAQGGRPGTLAPAAARAMALVAQAGGDEAGDRRSARERAQQAWSVMPVVYAGSELPRRAAPSVARGASDGASGAALATSWALGLDAMPAAGGDDAERGPIARGPLAARAGATLRSYVATSADGAPATTSASPPTQGSAGYRVPSAAPELVRPGTSPSFGPRFGGGEVEIPAWFESAARKMLEERSPGSDLSLADLTLVTAAPATAIAASTKSTTVSSTSASTGGSATSSTPDAASAPDLERLAREVYDQFLQLMDVARWRNYGDR